MFINQQTFSSMIFPYVWCLQNPSKPINVWWLNPRTKRRGPGEPPADCPGMINPGVLLWMPNRGPHRLSRLSVHDLEKTAVLLWKWREKSPAAVFFRTPKWWEKTHPMKQAVCFQKPLGWNWWNHENRKFANTGIYLTSRTGRRNRSPQKHVEFPIPHCLILTSRSLIHGCWPTFHLSKKVDDLFSIKATNTMWLCVFENSGSPRKDHGFNAVQNHTHTQFFNGHTFR